MFSKEHVFCILKVCTVVITHVCIQTFRGKHITVTKHTDTYQVSKYQAIRVDLGEFVQNFGCLKKNMNAFKPLEHAHIYLATKFRGQP